MASGSIWRRSDRPKNHWQLLDPVPSALEQPVKTSGLEPAQHLGVVPFCLTVAPGMSNRSEADLGAEVLDILHEGVACELRTVVGDDPVRDPEATNNRAEEFDHGLGRHLPHWFHFRPLCELVDCNVQVLKSPDSAGEGAEDIEPPDRKGPG